MRRIAVALVAVAIFAPVAVLAQEVRYDLGSEEGHFLVRIDQQFAGPVPPLVVVGSEHPDTEITACFGHARGERAEFPVGRWSRGPGMQADLRGLAVPTSEPLDIEWGADYFDLDCLQVKEDHLLFRRTTNFPQVQIALPAGFGLLFCNLETKVEYEADRVTLRIENPERARLEIDLVARRLAEE